MTKSERKYRTKLIQELHYDKRAQRLLDSYVSKSDGFMTYKWLYHKVLKYAIHDAYITGIAIDKIQRRFGEAYSAPEMNKLIYQMQIAANIAGLTDQMKRTREAMKKATASIEDWALLMDKLKSRRR